MQLETIAAPFPLFLSYAKGSSDRLILVFSGVGSPTDSVPKLEAPLLAGWDGENHVLFISDAQRTWMNAAGMLEALVQAVTTLVARIKPARIVTFGNSMGGSMAMIFANYFRVDAVLAMVPQFSAKPELVPEERRWRPFRNKITEWPIPSVPSLNANAATCMILHGGDVQDMHHARRFRAAGNVEHYILPQCSHSLAANLKKTERIRPLMEAFILGDYETARSVVQIAGGITFAEAWQRASDARKARRERSRHDAV